MTCYTLYIHTYEEIIHMAWHLGTHGWNDFYKQVDALPVDQPAQQHHIDGVHRPPLGNVRSETSGVHFMTIKLIMYVH